MIIFQHVEGLSTVYAKSGSHHSWEGNPVMYDQSKTYFFKPAKKKRKKPQLDAVLPDSLSEK